MKLTEIEIVPNQTSKMDLIDEEELVAESSEDNHDEVDVKKPLKERTDTGKAESSKDNHDEVDVKKPLK